MTTEGGVERLAAAVREAAQRALEREEWDEAAHLAKEVLVILPDDPVATDLLAAAERGRGTGDGALEEGRRYLTVLFSDLVDSTPLSERLDPEDYVTVITRYRDVVRTALRRHGGSIDQFQGDGVVAYFGFPIATEYDQVHAAEAGLEIVSGTAEVGQELGLDLTARVAVHVGRTVLIGAGLGARDQSAAISFAANVAARIQGHARPGTVVVSETAADATASYFELRPLEPVALKGVTEPLKLFEVQAPRPLTTGGDTRLAQPLVGRAVERASIDAAWSATKAGGAEPRLVVLLGEPGIGKSRLVRYATDLAGADGLGLIEINCGRALTHVGLGAVRGAVEKALDVGPQASPETMRDALAARGSAMGLAPTTVAVLQAVLGDVPGSTLLPEMAPDRLREAIIQALLDWIAAEADQAPVVLVVEDLQWADDTALEAIRRLTARPLPPGLMAVLTCRAGELPSALQPLRRGALEIGPLPDGDAAELVRAFALDRDLDPEALDLLRRRGEGVPLFMEHLVLAASASEGDVDIEADSLPVTLEGLLQTRISASGPGRAVAEVASVIGREFTVELVEQTLGSLGERAPCRPDRAVAALRLLERAGLVEPDGTGRMRFRHSLVRDVAYEMQLRRDRPHRHRAVAQASIAVHGPDATPGALAYHHERAGDLEPAAAAHLRAAEQAAQLAEFERALQHLRTAGELVGGLDTPTARRLELAQCMQVGGVAAASFSFAREEAARAYERALVLCDLIASQDGGDLYLDVQLVGALGGLWAKEVVAGNLPAARAITDRLERLLELRSVAGEPDLPRFVHGCRGLEELYAGDTTAALAALAEGASADAPTPVSVSLGTPHDSVASAGAILAVARTLAGDDAGADVALAAAVERSQRIPFPVGPFSEAVVAVYAAYLHRLRGDLVAAHAAAETVRAVGDRHGFQEHAMLGQMLDLVAGALGGDPGDCQSLDAMLSVWRMTGGGLAAPVLLAELAEGYLRCDNLEGARKAIADGFDMLEPTDQRGAEPALVRVTALADAAAGHSIDQVVAGLVAAADLSLSQGSPRLAARAVHDLRTVCPDGRVPPAAMDVARRTRAAIPAGANEDLRAIERWISASV